MEQGAQRLRLSEAVARARLVAVPAAARLPPAVRCPRAQAVKLRLPEQTAELAAAPAESEVLA